MAIQKTTNEELQKIKNRSALSLPDRPSEYGMKPSDIRRALTMPIFGDTHSVLAELNRVVDELNALMDGEQGADETLTTIAQTIKGAINELNSIKVSKNTDSRRIYATDANGNTTTYPWSVSRTAYSTNVEKNSFVRRDNGRIPGVADPSDSHDASTKGYVDASINELFGTIQQILSELYSRVTDDISGETENAIVAANAYSDDRLSEHVNDFSDRLDHKADLVDGKVPAAQLPSFVDDVLEYDSILYFPETGESGKIYIAKNTNKTYRWGGSSYAEISESLALGETSDTAYAGNKGKANAEAIASLQTAVGNRYTKAETDAQISTQIDAAKAVSGTVTLLSGSWSGSTYSLSVQGLGENDSIFFAPVTAAGKTALEDADILLSASGTTVVFTASGDVPENDVSLNYTIVRGTN